MESKPPTAKDLIASIRTELSAGRPSVIPTAPQTPGAAPTPAAPVADPRAEATMHEATLKSVGLGPVQYHPAVGLHLKVL